MRRRYVGSIIDFGSSFRVPPSIQVGRIWGIVARPVVDNIFPAANRLFAVGF